LLGWLVDVGEEWGFVSPAVKDVEEDEVD